MRITRIYMIDEIKILARRQRARRIAARPAATAEELYEAKVESFCEMGDVYVYHDGRWEWSDGYVPGLPCRVYSHGKKIFESKDAPARPLAHHRGLEADIFGAGMYHPSHKYKGHADGLEVHRYV